MDPRNCSRVEGRYDGQSTAELLAGINAEVRGRRASQVREWAAIVAWADRNVVEGPEGAATLTEGFLDTGVPIAGPGAPLVSEFGLMELIATLERSPDGGRAYVGRIIECAWRLPSVYAAVLEGRCSPWRAERVADLTRALSRDAAAHVDTHIGFTLGTCTWAQVERLVAKAITLYDPALAEIRRQDAADHRHLDIDLDRIEDGLVHIDGCLDASDGADLDHAVSRRAHLLGKLGHDGSLDVRRAVAVGDLARSDLTLDLEVVDEATGEVTVASPGRRAVLHVHISDAALGGGAPVGRWEDQQVPISTEQIREWLATSGTSVVVKPVIELAEHVPVDSYEIPARITERVRLRDHSCRFPGCPRPASKCDIDHAQAHNRGGVTCPCNLAALCRRHHRAKTHSEWRYAVIDPGTYLWISPNGRHFLVDHRGTRALDPPTRLEPQTIDTVHEYETQWPHLDAVPACPGIRSRQDRPPGPDR